MVIAMKDGDISSDNIVVIEPTQVVSFIEALFRYAPDDSFVALRGFDDLKKDKKADYLAEAVVGRDDVAQAAITCAESCARFPHPVVACLPTATFKKTSTAKAEDLRCGLALTVDLDQGSPGQGRAKLESLLGKATVVVASGGEINGEPKLHLHWRLSEPAEGEDIAKLEKARELAAAMVGGDASGKSVVHCFRFPGSIHRKGEPKLVRIEEINTTTEIDLDDALERLGDVHVETPPNAGDDDSADDDKPKLEALIQRVHSGESYHASLVSLSAIYASQGMNVVTIRITLRGFMNGSTAPRDKRWKDRYNDIPDIARSAVKKFKRIEKNQAGILIGLIESQAHIFKDDGGTVYADVERNGHRNTWSVDSGAFHNWLNLAYWNAKNAAPGRDALIAALKIVQAKADNHAPTFDVFIRVGQYIDKLYVDLCDDAHRAIEIDNNGWRIVHDPPCRFLRYPGMLSLPEPKRGGSINDLRQFMNMDDDQFVLVVGFLLNALRPDGPYFALSLSGEEGSAKSYATTVLRDLIDPNDIPLTSPPKNTDDLWARAKHSHMLAFDNLSRLSPDMSDAICRLAIMAGDSKRGLYTNNDEVSFKASLPIILNGIDDMIERGDLGDRSIDLQLTRIADDHRRTQEELDAAFIQKQPYILGALCDAIVVGLKTLPTLELKELPRMADSAKWIIACEDALFDAGSFMNAYKASHRTTMETVLDSDLAGVAMLNVLAQADIKGTANDILQLLKFQTDYITQSDRRWPKTAKAMGGVLRRLANAFREQGFEVTLPTKDERAGHNRDSLFSIVKPDREPVPWRLIGQSITANIRTLVKANNGGDQMLDAIARLDALLRAAEH